MDGPHVIAVSVDTGQARRLVRGIDAKYLESGHLLFGHGKEVMVAPFDMDRVELTGAIRSIDLIAAADEFGSLSVDVSRNGTLVFAPPLEFAGGRLAWVDL